jgi:hypothetical protein
VPWTLPLFVCALTCLGLLQCDPQGMFRESWQFNTVPSANEGMQVRVALRGVATSVDEGEPVRVRLEERLRKLEQERAAAAAAAAEAERNKPPPAPTPEEQLEINVRHNDAVVPRVTPLVGAAPAVIGLSVPAQPLFYLLAPLNVGSSVAFCLVQRRVFHAENPGLVFTPDRYAAFEALADAVFAQLGVPEESRKWNGSVVDLEALIDKVVPPPESPEERAARLQREEEARVAEAKRKAEEEARLAAEAKKKKPAPAAAAAKPAAGKGKNSPRPDTAPAAPLPEPSDREKVDLARQAWKVLVVSHTPLCACMLWSSWPLVDTRNVLSWGPACGRGCTCGGFPPPPPLPRPQRARAQCKVFCVFGCSIVTCCTQGQLGVLIGEASFPPLESSLLFEFARSIVCDIADMVPKIVGGVRKAAGLPARSVHSLSPATAAAHRTGSCGMGFLR